MDAHALSRCLAEPKPKAGTRFCGKCKPPHLCCCLAVVQAPLQCVPCARSQTREDIYAEIPVSGDWDGRNFVMRIGCTCDKCMAPELEKDDTRIVGFELIDEAVSQWNLDQRLLARSLTLHEYLCLRGYKDDADKICAVYEKSGIDDASKVVSYLDDAEGTNADGGYVSDCFDTIEEWQEGKLILSESANDSA